MAFNAILGQTWPAFQGKTPYVCALIGRPGPGSFRQDSGRAPFFDCVYLQSLKFRVPEKIEIPSGIGSQGVPRDSHSLVILDIIFRWNETVFFLLHDPIALGIPEPEVSRMDQRRGSFPSIPFLRGHSPHSQNIL